MTWLYTTVGIKYNPNDSREKLDKYNSLFDYVKLTISSNKLSGIGSYSLKPGYEAFIDFTAKEYADKFIEVTKKEGLIKTEISNKKYTPHTIKPLTNKVDMSVFSEKEKQIIEQMKERFKSSTAREVEMTAKNEPPYKMVKSGEIIPYHLAFYRNSFDEMSLGNEDLST